jgi:hypothetical protein
MAYVPLATKGTAIRAYVIAGTSVRFRHFHVRRLLAFVLLLSFALLASNFALAADRDAVCGLVE